MGYRLPGMLALLLMLSGCGSTKWTDTSRSATEQLLISDAMDRAVSRLDFRALAGKEVWVDTKPLQGVTDSNYLISSLRQHMLASGCILKGKENEAKYVVEVRSGGVGTDHHELVYGVPGVDIPATIPVAGAGIPSSIPELKFITRTDKRAVVKLAVFAYNRETGRPVWQSGITPVDSTAKAFWIFGAGPFQRGDIYKGTAFAGDKLKIPLIDVGKADSEGASVSVADEAYFLEPGEEPPDDALAAEADGEEKPPADGKQGKPAKAEVIQAGHAQASDLAPAKKPPPKKPPAGKPATTDPPAPAKPLPKAAPSELPDKKPPPAPPSESTEKSSPKG